MKYSYVSLYEKNAAYFRARPNLKKGLLFFDRFLTLGFVLGYTTFVLGAIALEYPAEDLVKIFFAPALCRKDPFFLGNQYSLSLAISAASFFLYSIRASSFSNIIWLE